MKRTVISKVLLGLILLLSISLSAQSRKYANYSASWPYQDFLVSASGGGGSPVSVKIVDDVLTLTFSAGGFSSTQMHLGQIKQLSTNPQLGNRVLGTLVGGYTVEIQNGWLTITHPPYTESISGFSKTFTVILSPFLEISNSEVFQSTTQDIVCRIFLEKFSKEESGSFPAGYQKRTNTNGIWSSWQYYAVSGTGYNGHKYYWDFPHDKHTQIRFLHGISGYTAYSNIIQTGSKNYIYNKSFDENGNVFAESKSYYEDRGKLLQSQSKTPLTGVFINQPLYDNLERASGQTLKAPSSSEKLLFDWYFVRDQSNNRYNSTNFSKSIPDGIGNYIGTLGSYYSNNNSIEPFTPTTSYPFTKTEYYDDGSGEVKSATLPGDHFHTGNIKSYSKTFPVMQDLDGKYRDVFNILFSETKTSFANELVKTVARDANGNEVISYNDENGNSLVSAYGYVAGGIGFDLNLSYFSEDDDSPSYAYIDVHIPEGTTVAQIATTYEDPLVIIDLLSGLGVSGSLSQGFYRIEMAGELDINYSVTYYDASFNFYDDMGQLRASVSPLGVKVLIDGFSLNATSVWNIPYTTYYTYDFQGRLLSMREPDAGTTNYIYRRDGSIRFSQNAKQEAKGTFSYTNYDKLGRPVESGEYTGDAFTFDPDRSSSEYEDLEGILENTDEGGGLIQEISDRKDWVRTYYDLEDQDPTSTLWLNENDVVLNSFNPAQTTVQATNSITLLPGFSTPAGSTFQAAIATPTSPSFSLPDTQDFLHGAVSYTENENSKTWYSYDEMGRVTWMATWYPAIFDEPKMVEYEYDFLGNVTYVKYQDGSLDNDAFYHRYVYDADKRLSKVYASTSPIASSGPSIADLQAEYQYYLHGPLKKVVLANGLEETEYFYTLQGWLKSINNPATTNSTFAQSFHYFDGDYTRNGVSFPNLSPPSPQYNGNIASIKYSSHYGATTIADQMNYVYDGKYQLTNASNGTNNNFKVENLAYDANGNIQSVRRKNADGSTNLHDLAYNYIADRNQLNSVADIGTDNYDVNYTYNSIGEMLTMERQSDPKQTFDYDVTGKVKSIDNTAKRLEYEYDDRGFRIRTIDRSVSTDQGQVFVRDASGSIMAIYKRNNDNSFTTLEHPVYGASRLGTYFKTNDQTQYELKDHLGNVRALIEPSANTGETEEIFDFSFLHSIFDVAAELSISTSSYNSYPSSLYLNEDANVTTESIPVSASTVAIEVEVMMRHPSSTGSITIKFDPDDGGAIQTLAVLNNTSGTWTAYTTGTLNLSQSGAIYFFIDNSDEDYGLYIDDVKITKTHLVPSVLQASNYYPFGLKMNIGPTADYRYGYQGDFAEEDPETGFNHFEARDYDPVIGRWMNVDPAGQYASPYVGMGNNPISGVDPDGAWVKDAGFFNNVFHSDQWNFNNMGSTMSPTELNYATYGAGSGSLSYASQHMETYMLQPVTIGAEGNYVTAAIYQGHEDFMNHPVTQGAMFVGGFFIGADAYLLARGFSGAKYAVQGVTTYTKSSLALGREVHALYKIAEHAPSLGRYKEFAGIKGIRPDFVDFATKTIYELKPYNPRGIQLGTKQLNNYKSIFQQNYGGTWNTVLDFY